jgi:vitamin B12 transporter
MSFRFLHLTPLQPPAMRLALLPSSILVVALPLGAQQSPSDTSHLNPMVTTATRTPVVRDSVPESVTVLQGDDLRARGIVSIADALKDVPGVAIVQTGSFGGTTSLFMRGGQSTYTKVLIDGVPVNQSGGVFDFGQLTVDNVDHIEIVRGPSSVVWGSDAVSGVIQIFTRTGGDGQHVTVSSQAGSYGTVDAEGAVFGQAPGASYSFDLAHHMTSGIYAFNNQYANTTLSGRTLVHPDSATDLSLSLRYTDFAAHYPTDYTGAPVDSNAYNTDTELALGLDLARRITSAFSLHLALNSSQTDGGTDDAADYTGGSPYQSLDHIVRNGADLRGLTQLSSSTLLTTGVSTEEESQRSQSQSGGSFPSTSLFIADRHNTAGYAELLTHGDGATVTLGARVDDNQAFGTFGTYRAGALYGFSTGTRIRANVGTAFTEPSFFENYSTGFVVGNPNLKPEHADSWEAAVGQSLLGNRVDVEAIYFNQRFHDLIDYNGNVPPGEPNYFNIAQAMAAGEELTLSAELPSHLALTGSLTHLDTKVLSGGFDSSSTSLLLDGHPLLRRPSLSWSTGIGYHRAEQGAIDLRINYVGSRDDLLYSYGAPYTALDTLAAYTTVDLSGEVTLVRPRPGHVSLAATFRGANVFDAKYQSIAGYLSPGRVLLIGAKVGM